MRKFIFASSVALLSFATGCENYKAVLEPLQRYTVVPPSPQKTVNVDFCTDPAVPEKTAVKTVIILDHSGSNKLNYMMAPDGSGNLLVNGNQVLISPTLGTDPLGNLRYGSLTTPNSLLQYLSVLPPNDPVDPLKYFAVVNFSDAASTFPAGSSGFTGDIPNFYQHILSDARGGAPTNPAGVPVDAGGTSYLSALQATYNMIRNDISTAKACAAQPVTATPTMNCPHPGKSRTSSYAIVMATDGAPIIDVNGLAANGTVTGPLQLIRESTNEILGLVQSIVALTSDKKYVAGINLFTVHYVSPNNNVDNTARTLLAEMARVGNGIPYVSVSGSSIDYTRFQPPARLIKYLLSDLFVTNISGAFGNDGLWGADNDHDGLTNAIEIAWGSNQNQFDSNGNGVNDMVEHHLRRGANCTIKNGSGLCIDAAINYRASGGACSGISFSGGRYLASDPNGLNDCEKVLLADTGGINNPDSNSDGVPDWLAFKNGVSFQLGSVPAFLSTMSDGYTHYQKIKFSMPVQTPITALLNFKPSNYALRQVSNSATQTCYNLKVTDLPFIGNTDRIRVELVERSELLQDRFLYRTAEKNFVATETTLNFKDWNNTDEITAGTWKVWP